ncbi:helix-turn-helix domain-containing protein [Mesobacillus subterraneus]|uniref:helix-turn-helix transcriptional regulator n=1 Tax=Mesobacillus subterraneus TaxID=285983 RepID=UPI00203B9B43|nr:helix-turn-helix domain-containing protein [Mesobacillus subterraneus]MCM3572522.1 helix-turn-helix domain-containing protein [Mesobacillus subterraneus]
MEAKVLIALRKMHGLTQHEIASILGVSRALIAIVETERQPISRNLARKVIETFGEHQIAVVQIALKAIEGGKS